MSEQNFAVIQIPDCVLEGCDDASQSRGDQTWVCTLLLLQRESPMQQLTHIQETVALNWMRHWACNFGMYLSEVDWEETREVSPNAASDEYCQTRIVICTGHLCYPGLVWTLQVTTAPATGLLSSQQWHIFQISKWSYWIICNLNWEKPTAGGGLFEFITKMSVIHIRLDMAPGSCNARLLKCCHSDHCWHALTWWGQGSWTLVIRISHLVLTTRLPSRIAKSWMWCRI